MKSAPLHPQENERLKALNSLNILDTLPEKEFDELTLLASRICNAPISLISLIDKNRQWFKSKQGVDANETPRDVAFCAHVILENQVFNIPDALKDPRFSDNPLVTSGPKIRFYAGVPIFDPRTQLPIGSFCVIDQVPRELTQEQIESLDALRNQVQRVLQLRIEMIEAEFSHIEMKKLVQHQELVLQGAGLGSWDWNLETNEVFFDKRWCDMLGIKHNEVVHNLSTWDNLCHPEDKAKAYKDIKSHLEGHTEYYENIHRLKHVDGSWVWILDRGKISEKTSEGKPKRFTGTHFDITYYKKNELISEKIQKIANIGGWELNVETGKTRWTEQTYKIHEVDPEVSTDKIMGIDFYAVHERPKITAYIHSCIAGKPFRDNFDFIDSIGNLKKVEVSGVPSFDVKGKVKSIIGTFQDITELAQVQTQLEEAQQISKIGNWSFELETKNVVWSKETYRIFEIDQSESQENLFKIYRSRFHPDDLIELDKAVEETVKNGQPYKINHRIFLDNGKRVKYVQGYGHLVLDAKGKPVKIFGTCHDITEKVLAEMELEKSRVVALHTAKLASLGEMAAGVAHEINNPLAIIDGTISMLKKFINDEVKFDAKISTVLKATMRISRIVNGLRKFSRSSEASNMNENDIGNVIKETMIFVELKAKQNHTILNYELNSHAKVFCNSLEIEQVLINLINNAIDAVRPLEERWVKVQLFDENSEVVIRVIDSGQGIDSEISSKLFNPFFTTKAVGEGTGLGLSICKGILENHKAEFFVNSKMENTCFEIRFKKAESARKVS